jgi:hypothetical protein
VKSGDAAEADDTWLRPITNENHIRRATIHHGEFKKWLGPPDDVNSPWKLELSGRLLSLVESISKDANEKVAAQKARLAAAEKPIPSALKYCGIIHSTVENVRAIPDLDGDVIYEPTEDTAHANIVVRDKGPDQILTVTEILMRYLAFIGEADVSNHAVFSSSA